MEGTECTPESLTCPECGVNEGQGSLKFPRFIKIYRKSGENERNSYLRQFTAGKGEVLFFICQPWNSDRFQLNASQSKGQNLSDPLEWIQNPKIICLSVTNSLFFSRVQSKGFIGKTLKLSHMPNYVWKTCKAKGCKRHTGRSGRGVVAKSSPFMVNLLNFCTLTQNSPIVQVSCCLTTRQQLLKLLPLGSSMM